MEKFRIFVLSLKRRYGNIEYIRTIEVQKKSHNFHIHMVIIFKDSLPKIKKAEIQKIWKYGNVDFKHVYDIHGLLDYLTLNKPGIQQKKNPNLTYFPIGAKVFASTVKSFAEKRESSISDKELDWLLSYSENGKHKRLNGHYYNDNGTTRYCLDSIQINIGKDFVINNYGTKEDDEILNKPKE